MTISEQLHFSILTAPIAAADRRALSQAWYSALYSAKDTKVRPGACKTASQGRVAHLPASARSSNTPALAVASLARRIHAFGPPRAAAGERRLPQQRLARQIVQLVRRRASARVAATFVLDGTRARVRVLVVAAGGSVRLIAICSKRVRDCVARALEEARYASAAHGIHLLASTREDVRC